MVADRLDSMMREDGRARALHQIVALARAHHGLTGADICAAMCRAAAAGLVHRSAEARRGADSRARVLIMRVARLSRRNVCVCRGRGVHRAAVGHDEQRRAGGHHAGPGIAACVLAVMSSRDERFEKAVPPLFLIAAVLEPWACSSPSTSSVLAVMRAGPPSSRLVSSVSSSGASSRVLRQSMLLFLAVFFGTLFWMTAFDLIQMDDERGALVLGGSLVLAAIGVGRTPHGSITPPWFLFGAMAFLYGLFDLVGETPFEILFIITASGFVYLSAAIQSRTLLLVSTAAILGYTGWFTGEHFADSVGWPLALVMFGLLMIALSALAFRIDRQYIRWRRGNRSTTYEGV